MNEEKLEGYLQSIDHNLRQLVLDLDCRYYKSPAQFEKEIQDARILRIKKAEQSRQNVKQNGQDHNEKV